MKYYYLDNKVALNGKYGEISTGLLEEKKSKFYSYVFNIDNELDAIEKINSIKRDNRDARHVVYI
jgi:putative IMPACT (imprinted ancient) family translation regulator